MQDKESNQVKELAETLKTVQTPGMRGVNRLKFFYRPYICPFHDLLSFIPPQARVVDVGCGVGQFAFLVQKHCEPERILGLEIQDSLVTQCQRLIQGNRLSNVSVQKYNGWDFPACVKDYHVFTLIDILHHIPGNKQLRYLENVYETMKPEDILILKDIDARSKLVFLNKLHDLILARQISHERSAEEVKCFCLSLGFRIRFYQKKNMSGYPHFTLVLQK